MAKRARSKAARNLVTHRIVYAHHRYPRARNQELKVNLRQGTDVDTDYARAIVAVRASLALKDIKIVRIESC